MKIERRNDIFQDKVVLITGGSRGIGRATAIKFVKLGANVIAVYHSNNEKANSLVKEIKNLGGKYYKCRFVYWERNWQSSWRCSCYFWGNWYFINNAGIVFDREFEEITYSDSLQVFKTNALAPLFLSQKIVPVMLKNNGGVIINVSSTSGMYDFNPGTADYAMSKIALQSLTKDLSMKYAPKIRVNAVAPGWVDTDMNADLPKEFVEQETSKYHMNRWAKPEEIADTIIYLASDNASYITGQVIVLDGGHC